jgi:hypothetical protein
LVANAVEDENGRWSALDGRRVYQHARTAGFLYQTRLRAGLAECLGVEWSPVRRGVADIVGVPRPVLRAFSRRRVELEESLRSAGLSSVAAAQAAVLDTRRAKDQRRSAELLRAEWLERAQRLGLDEVAIDGFIGRAAPVRLSREDLDRFAEQMAGLEGLTKQASTFTRADALRAACELVPPGADVSVATLERTVDRLLASPAVVPVLRPTGGLPSDFRYTTAELLRLEERILASRAVDQLQPRRLPRPPRRARRYRRAGRWRRSKRRWSSALRARRRAWLSWSGRRSRSMQPERPGRRVGCRSSGSP